MSSRKFYLFVYDVIDDKRRRRVARCLESMGKRVQYSVFEVYLYPKELEKINEELADYIKPKKDSIRIYFLCGQCKEKIQTLGLGDVTPSPKVVIV